MDIILIEDDVFQYEWMEAELAKKLDASVLTLKSESEVIRRFAEIEARAPDCFVVDVMLPWTNPDELSPEGVTEAPEGCLDERTAGIRIQQLILNSARLSRRPVVLYTVLDRVDLPDGTFFVPKESTIDRLVAELTYRLRRSR